jgi:hypothetical protein
MSITWRKPAFELREQCRRERGNLGVRLGRRLA